MTKRLFIFASYDKDAIIDESVIVYLQSLSQLGDTVFYMDSDASETELTKVKPYTINRTAVRHSEYDFGSYKRGFVWAHDNLDLSKYYFVYLVNDSMYGPLHTIQQILENLESQKTNAFGMVLNPHKTEPHLQSWFLGMNKQVFLSDIFYKFITNVKKLNGKGLIAWAYEHGFTRMLNENNFSYTAAFNLKGRTVYNKIKPLYKNGFPFIKKLSFTRKNGALGRQILYVLNHIQTGMKNAIMINATRVYGERYLNKMLTRNPIKIMFRYAKHMLRKLFIEGI